MEYKQGVDKVAVDESFPFFPYPIKLYVDGNDNLIAEVIWVPKELEDSMDTGNLELCLEFASDRSAYKHMGNSSKERRWRVTKGGKFFSSGNTHTTTVTGAADTLIHSLNSRFWAIAMNANRTFKKMVTKWGPVNSYAFDNAFITVRAAFRVTGPSRYIQRPYASTYYSGGERRSVCDTITWSNQMKLLYSDYH